MDFKTVTLKQLVEAAGPVLPDSWTLSSVLGLRLLRLVGIYKAILNLGVLQQLWGHEDVLRCLSRDHWNQTLSINND